MLTADELAQIEARALLAHGGPWVAVDHVVMGPVLVRIAECWIRGSSYPWRENTEFIAHARQDIPALLAHVRALEGRVRLLNGLLDKLRGAWGEGWDCSRSPGHSGVDVAFGEVFVTRRLDDLDEFDPASILAALPASAESEGE